MVPYRRWTALKAITRCFWERPTLFGRRLPQRKRWLRLKLKAYPMSGNHGERDSSRPTCGLRLFIVVFPRISNFLVQNAQALHWDRRRLACPGVAINAVTSTKQAYPARAGETPAVPVKSLRV